MTEKEERAGKRISRLNIPVPLLVLCALFVSTAIFGGRIYEITPAPALQITAFQTSTASSTLMKTSTPINTPLTPTLTLTLTLTSTPRSTDTAMPVLTPTSVPPGLNLITVIGTTNEEYGFTVPNNTHFDATNWRSNAIGPVPNGTTSKAVQIYGTNNNVGGVKNVTWRGGVIVGSIPLFWDWRTTHDFGGGGFFIHNDGPIEWQYIRIHNVEDGIKFRELPEYSNTGSWLLRDCYFTAIRDDAIDNDRFEPGRVENCLFDGVYVFISEQNENVGTNTPIGPEEDTTIYIDHVYARLYGTNDAEGPGKWFKLLGDVPHHRLTISDSVFAIGSVPRLGWSDESIPLEVEWIGNNNFILWLGTPGTYVGPKPEGVTFLEGAAAEAKWISVRNQWLTDHGLPAQDLPADYNPHDAPVMQIPTGL